MINPVNNDLRGLVFETHRIQADLESSITKLSSGKRVHDAVEDSGAFQQAAKLISRNKRDHAAMRNLQNLISYSQTQDGTLQSVGEILNGNMSLAWTAQPKFGWFKMVAPPALTVSSTCFWMIFERCWWLKFQGISRFTFMAVL